MVYRLQTKQRKKCPTKISSVPLLLFKLCNTCWLSFAFEFLFVVV